MADQDDTIVVPEETRAKFPHLVELVLGSESMNCEERSYWINILPAMTPDQLQNLKEILENEKRQLQSIDRKYDRLEKDEEEKLLRKIAQKRKERQSKRTQTESREESRDEEVAEALLSEIEAL